MPLFILVAATYALPVLAGKTEPLHVAIDRLATVKDAAPLASDAEFLRRVWLDLAGTIPTSAEARAFLDDPSPDKRAKLIEKLLASKEHAQHLAATFDDLLMDRRPGKHVPVAEWRKFLVDSFAANKPYDVLVREILSADGSDPKTRPASRFFLDRDGEPHLLTRDIGRLFLGMNLACCQCHDHPQVNSYKQEHYYGIYAFLARTQLAADVKPIALSEKADGEATFTSVFDPEKVVKTAALMVPGGGKVNETKPAKGKEYRVAPAKGVRAVPTFSRRSLLAPQVTATRQFARTTANRLWALLLGRGLIHPIEFDHRSNPPSHPELLDRLTDELIAHKFDIRWFLREVALSQTYQRSSVGPANTEPLQAAHVRPLTAEQLARALMAATGLPVKERKDGVIQRFVRTFGGKPGEPDEGFQASLEQTLFVANGSLLRGWLNPRPGTLTDRLAKLKSDVEVADELFLSALTRRPTAEETKAVADYLKDRTADRPAALQELAWALLASTEFRFNH